MKSVSVESVEDLIPPEWEFIKAQNAEDLVFLGKDVIRSMIIYWRKEGSYMSPCIKELSSMSSISIENIVELAQKHENPCITDVGTSMGGLRGVPLDPESIMREGGATTFNICGWCNFANWFFRTERIKLESTCSFESESGMEVQLRNFNAPCFLKTASKDILKQVKQGINKKREILLEKKRSIDRKIKTLLAFEKTAEKKPIPPFRRPKGWFKNNDFVVCYFSDDDESTQFLTGRIICYQEGISDSATVCFFRKIADSSICEGYGRKFDTSSFNMMKLWEYEYFAAHPEFAVFAERWIVSLFSKEGSRRFSEVLSEAPKDLEKIRK